MRRISAFQLDQLLAAAAKPTCIEVLPREAFDEWHLHGAECACVYEVTFLDQVAKLAIDPNSSIVVYSSSADCRAADVAAERLLGAGYRNVAVLAGGKMAWQEAGFPCEGRAKRWVPRPPPQLRDGDYAVDVEKSGIEWTGRNAGGKHVGTMRLKGGSATVRGGALAAGAFDVDMRSIANLDLADASMRKLLVAHLQSDDFFAVARFPVARFTIARAGPTIEGALALRGVTLPLAFPATVCPLSGGALAMEAHFDLDRTAWGADYGSARLYEHLGMHVVHEPVSVQVRVVAR